MSKKILSTETVDMVAELLRLNSRLDQLWDDVNDRLELGTLCPNDFRWVQKPEGIEQEDGTWIDQEENDDGPLIQGTIYIPCENETYLAVGYFT